MNIFLRKFKSVLLRLCKYCTGILEHNNGLSISASRHNSIENVDNKNRSMSYWLECRETDRIFIEKVFDDITMHCEISSCKLVADYGCGTGVFVDLLKKKYKDIEVMGFDFSENKINNCKSFYKEISECFSVGSVYDTAKSKFDVIVSTEVFEHLDDPWGALRNLLTALRPSGKLLLTVPDGRTDTYFGHVHFWSPESWKLFIIRELDDRCKAEFGLMNGKNYALITMCD